MREAPALYVCAELAKRGITIRAFDPVAIPEAERALREHADRIFYAADAYDAVAGASAVVIMTEWNEFRALDLERVKKLVARPVLVDTRNVLEPARAREKGFVYHSTGRSAIGPAVRPRTDPALTPV